MGSTSGVDIAMQFKTCDVSIGVVNGLKTLTNDQIIHVIVTQFWPVIFKGQGNPARF